MKKSIFVLLFFVLLFSGLLGGNWSVANAQGTIPIIPPQIPPIIPITSVGGGATELITIPIKCENVVLEIKYVAKVVFKDCPKAGTKATMTVLSSDDVNLGKPIKPLTFLTEVFQVITDGTHQVTAGVYLSGPEITLLKKDSAYGLYRFDVLKQEWVRVIATLEGNFLSADTDVSGIFVVGKF